MANNAGANPRQKLAGWVSERALDTAARLWAQGKKPNLGQRMLLNVTGVRARVLRGKDPKADFTYLTEWKSHKKRPLAMWMRGVDLLKFAGKPVPKLLNGIGWHRSLTREYMAPDARLKLLLVAGGGATKPATWKHVIRLSQDIARRNRAPHVARALSEHRRTLERQPWDKLMPRDAQPKTLQEVAKNPRPSAVQLRQWLMTLGFYELYTGNGYTKQPDGKRGIPEFVSNNSRVQSFEHRRVIELK
jgi:hypothetical protein